MIPISEQRLKELYTRVHPTVEYITVFRVEGVYEFTAYYDTNFIFLFRVTQIEKGGVMWLEGEYISTQGANSMTRLEPQYYKVAPKTLLDFSLAKMKGQYVRS